MAVFSINLLELLTLRSVTFEGRQLNAEQFSKRGYSETAIADGCWTQTPGDRNVASAIEMKAGAGSGGFEQRSHHLLRFSAPTHLRHRIALER